MFFRLPLFSWASMFQLPLGSWLVIESSILNRIYVYRLQKNRTISFNFICAQKKKKRTIELIELNAFYPQSISIAIKRNCIFCLSHLVKIRHLKKHFIFENIWKSLFCTENTRGRNNPFFIYQTNSFQSNWGRRAWQFLILFKYYWRKRKNSFKNIEKVFRFKNTTWLQRHMVFVVKTF